MTGNLAKIMAAACAAKANSPIDDTNIAETMRRMQDWAPIRTVRRIVTMLHPPSLGDLQVLRDTAHTVQQGLHEVLLPNQTLWTRAFWFLDGCAHSSNWSRSMIDAADETNQAHCYQGESRYQDAFASLVSEQAALRANDPFEKIDGIVMIGNKFSEDARRVTEQVKQLTDHGTRLFAFHIPPHEAAVTRAFEEMTGLGGSTVRVSSIQETKEYVPLLTQAIIDPRSGRLALENHSDVGKRLALGFDGN